MTIRVRETDGSVSEIHDLSVVPRLLQAGTPLWIDAEGVDAELSPFLTEVLKLHPLAAEDIIEDQETPKAEDYGAYLYIVALPPMPAGAGGAETKAAELDIVLGSTWVFTHHRGASSAVNGVLQELARQPRS